jgi:hypothetical protein
VRDNQKCPVPKHHLFITEQKNGGVPPSYCKDGDGRMWEWGNSSPGRDGIEEEHITFLDCYDNKELFVDY